MNPRAVLVGVALCAACLFPASASAEVRITFGGGRVSIQATNATLAEILNEWARVGGSTFVNLDKLTSGDRVTLLIESELETRAMETLLRNTAGYFIAPQVDGSTSPSALKRIYIVGATRGTPSAEMTSPIPAPMAQQEAPPQFVSPAPPAPDNDGPVRRQTPPPAPEQQATTASNPAGNSSPVPKGTTQTLPGLGIVTSTTPGTVINSPATTRQRPTVTPTRPGGGGGVRRR